jgi:hypothetical protein
MIQSGVGLAMVGWPEATLILLLGLAGLVAGSMVLLLVVRAASGRTEINARLDRIERELEGLRGGGSDRKPR